MKKRVNRFLLNSLHKQSKNLVTWSDWHLFRFFWQSKNWGLLSEPGEQMSANTLISQQGLLFSTLKTTVPCFLSWYYWQKERMSATSLLAYRTQACMSCTKAFCTRGWKLQHELLEENRVQYYERFPQHDFRDKYGKKHKATFFIPARNLTRKFHLSLHRSETRTQKKRRIFPFAW